MSRFTRISAYSLIVSFNIILGGMLSAAYAQSSGYPAKPVRAVVPFAPGSATDQVARAFTAKMGELLGQPFVVENKPGANGMLGADTVAKAAPDGYTILIGTNSTNAALKSLMKRLPYDQDTAFSPVAFLGQVPLIVAINSDMAPRNLKEFVAFAKARPNVLNYASASTSQRVSTEMLMSMAGIQMTLVPYKSSPAAITDLIGGQVSLFTADFAVMLPQVKAGKVRGLAVTSTSRSKAVPDLPTVNEALGIKDYELIAFFAIYAPAGTPPSVVAQLNKAANAAAVDKDILSRFSGLGFETDPGPPEALAERTRRETLKWAKAIKDAGIEPE
jgi:tripartite-type tricarboxylate transporter receptor subunit TctC